MKKKAKNKKIFLEHKAFSLVEVMFSVFVLSTGIVAVIALMTNGVSTSMDARNQIIASELAQEGVELVRNIRDNNWQSTTGDTSFTGIEAGSNCRIDKGATGISCGNDSTVPKVLNLDSNGFYVHDAGTATKFQRRIFITGGVASTRRVISLVRWDGSAPTGSTAIQVINNCNAKNKCAYTEVTLSEWGE